MSLRRSGSFGDMPTFTSRTAQLQFLARGHSVHFSVPDGTKPAVGTPLRVDIMSRMLTESPDARTTLRIRRSASYRKRTVVLPTPGTDGAQ